MFRHKTSTTKQQEQVRFIEYWLKLPYTEDINDYNSCKEFIDTYLNDAALESEEYEELYSKCF